MYRELRLTKGIPDLEGSVDRRYIAGMEGKFSSVSTEAPIEYKAPPKGATPIATQRRSIYFDTGSANMSLDSRAVVNEIGDFMRAYENTVVDIDGNTDATGSRESEHEPLEAARRCREELPDDQVRVPVLAPAHARQRTGQARSTRTTRPRAARRIGAPTSRSIRIRRASNGLLVAHPEADRAAVADARSAWPLGPLWLVLVPRHQGRPAAAACAARPGWASSRRSGDCGPSTTCSATSSRAGGASHRRSSGRRMVAIPLGLLMGAFPWVFHFVNPVAAPMRSMPITAFLPAFIALFGMDEAMKIGFLFFGMFFYLLAVVVEEVNKVDHALLETAYTLGAKIHHVLWLLFRAVVPGHLQLVPHSLRHRLDIRDPGRDGECAKRGRLHGGGGAQGARLRDACTPASSPSAWPRSCSAGC